MKKLFKSKSSKHTAKRINSLVLFIKNTVIKLVDGNKVIKPHEGTKNTTDIGERIDRRIAARSRRRTHSTSKRRRICIGVISVVLLSIGLIIVLNSKSGTVSAVAATVQSETAQTTSAVQTTSEMASPPDTAAVETQSLPSPSNSKPLQKPTAPSATKSPASSQEELKIGDKNDKVKALQERLMDLGYLEIDVATSYFGSSTQFALELFQRQHGLQIDGIYGGETRSMLNSDNAQPYTMLQGAKGNDIEAFQQRLKELGYLKKVTSFFGTETADAVKAFQKRNNLTVDGKAGENTLNLIYSPQAKGPVVIVSTVGLHINNFIALARKQLGKRYVWGAQGPKTFDCSGLVYYCLTHNGIKTGRFNALGYSNENNWKRISNVKDLKKGDLLFFKTNGKAVGHTGIYIGGGMMIDASSGNGKVVERAFDTYWQNHFVVGRRPWK
jgi:cell wall-associated NlpC family hydrolase